MHETELKFQIPAARRAALWAAFKRGRTSQTRLHAHYFDTADGRLAQQGLSLRLRREDDVWVQTLKAGTEHGIVRLEHNAEIEAAAGTVPALDLQRHADSPAYEPLMRALQDGGATTHPLVEVYRTEVTRHTRLLKTGSATVEAAFDQGRVVAGEASAELCELEFELKFGPVAALFTCAARWMTRHGLWLDLVSKAQRGHLLVRGLAHGEAVHARPPAVDASMPASAFVRAVVGACLQQVLPNSSAVASGSPQEEHVHQLRVGLRRLRTALRELGDLDAALDPAWEAPLAEVFRGLGVLRDRQLRLTDIAQALLAAGAPPMPAVPLGETPIDAAALVRSLPFQRALLAVLAFSLDDTPARGEAPAKRLIERLDQLHRQLRRRAGQFSALPAEQQHRLRKRLKRLRYLAEFIGPLFRKSAMKKYFEQLRPAQDALGLHNDEAVALADYRAQAELDAHAWFVVGWLSARQQVSAETAARALKKAVAARPFWHGVKKRKQA